MRPARMASLLALCLLIAGVQTKLHAQPMVRASRPDNSKTEMVSWTIEGLGESQEDAEKNAYEKTQSKILRYFSDDLQMPLEWTPQIEDIKRQGLVKNMAPVETVPLGGDAGAARRVRLQVTLLAKDYHEFLKKDRDYRVQQRQFFLGKLLAGLVVFLTAVAGYFRLDEATKGYYTGWLRLAALGLVGTVGVGLWWII